MNVATLQNVSLTLAAVIGNKGHAIYPVYPQVLPHLAKSDIGEDLMDELGLAFIGTGEAYLRFACSLITFLISVIEDDEHHDCPFGQRHGWCPLDTHFGLKHHHLDNFEYWNRVKLHRACWSGYKAAAIASDQATALQETKELFATNGHDVHELKDRLPPLVSKTRYEASFVTLDNMSVAPQSAPFNQTRDDLQLATASSQLSTLIHNESDRLFTLVGGEDDEVALYGTVAAYLGLSKGLIDFVLAARRTRQNLPNHKPLISIELRRFFDAAYSFYPMDTVCLAETQTEVEQALRFFRLDG